MTKNASQAWTSLLALAGQLQDSFDSEVETWLESYQHQGGSIYCTKGCASCCNLAVVTTLPEAARIAPQLTAEQTSALQTYIERLQLLLPQAGDLKGYLRLHRQQLGPCPFLTSDGACGVYSWRPLACRALLSTRNSDWCAVDFAELHPLEKEAFMSSLDRQVVAFPTHYAAAPQELATEREGELNHAMQDTFGWRVNGNLPLLVWLEARHQFSSQWAENRQAALALLQDQQLDLRFVLQLD